MKKVHKDKKKKRKAIFEVEYKIKEKKRTGI